jgi:hypothetical protein
MRRSSPLRAVRGARLVGSFALCGALLCACGGGGGGGGGARPLTIETPSLPTAGLDTPYSTTLVASGGAGGYVWTLLPSSSLPPGLGLAANGHLSGTPTTEGTYSFSVQVADAGTPPSADSATYQVQVKPFTASLSGLAWGDAWAGSSYALTSVGGGGHVMFTIVANSSGGWIEDADAAAGTATYVAGPVSGGTDVIRAANGTADQVDVSVDVVANPVGHMTATFSTTDVWHVRFSGKFDTHPYASDFHQALAQVGLRAPTSTDVAGTTADQIAETYVRQQTLRWLNVFYLNAPDGTPQAGGLKVSFPFYAPPSPPYSCPSNGNVVSPGANQYNVISVISGGQGGTVGTAYLDSTSNVTQENDTTSSSAGALGVFVDEITTYFNPSYSNDTLPTAPIGAGDVAALKALLYGEPSPGGRYAELKRIGEGFGRTLAAVAAHEIGHSLGLQHTSPAVESSIMNASMFMSPSATYWFVEDDLTILRSCLPGPARGGSPQHVITTDDAFVALMGIEVPIPDERTGDDAVVCGACALRSR